MDRPYSTASLDAKNNEYSATVYLALARSSLPLRVLLALVFPFYALTASKLEFASVLVLAWLITQLLSAAEDRDEAIVRYDSLSRYLIHTYISSVLVCHVFPNRWLHVFVTYFASFSEVLRLFPFAGIVYRVRVVNFLSHTYRLTLSHQIVHDAEASRLRSRDRATHRFALGAAGLIGASWTLCSGAIDGKGSTLWLLLQFILVIFMVGSSVYYASVAWMLTA